jgi:hypothetical protein
MTAIDIKNLNTTEIKQVKEWCEQELKFREEIGEEIERRKQYDNGIRNYPDGALAYSVTRNP